MTNTSFDPFAEEYDKMMGDTGDFSHQNTIDKCLFKLAGDVKDLKIYDLACGNGYIARKFINNGASEIWASDISQKLIDLAVDKYEQGGIKYLCRPADDFNDIPENHFDLVTMNMAIFYIENLDGLLSGVYKILKPDGKFVFTYDHPLRQVAYLKMGIDIDILTEYEDYLNSGLKYNFNHWTKKNDLAIYRRPIGEMINALGRNNLLVQAMEEPPAVAELKGKEIRTNIPYKMGIAAIKK